MKLEKLTTTEQLERFLNGSQAVLFEISSVKKNAMPGLGVSSFDLTIYSAEKSTKAFVQSEKNQDVPVNPAAFSQDPC